MPNQAFQPSKLVVAIRSGRLSEVTRAIEDGADIEEADIHGVRGLPLRTACFEGSMAIVRELLRAGADVNAMAADGPGAPLRLALRRGHSEVVAFLLQNEAEIPAGLVIDPTILNRVGTLSPLSEETSVPLLPEPVPDYSRESIPPAIDLALEEVELPAAYSTDTDLLTMDLLEIDETPQGTAPAPAVQPGFWKSSRSN